MAWTAPSTWISAAILTAAQLNQQLRDNLLHLSTHAHSGAAGDGSASLNGLVKADFLDAAAPAAPGAGLTRLYTVSGKPRYRAAGGADLGIVVGGQNWRVLYLDGSGEPVYLALGVAGTVLMSNGASAAPTMQNAAAHKLVRKTSSEGSAVTTLQDDDQLLFAIGANEVWAWEAVLFYEGAGDLKVSWTVPSGASLTYSLEGLDSADAYQSIGASGTVAFGTGGAVRVGVMHGYVANGATPGNVQLQFSQLTLDATPVQVNVGSHIVAHRIA